MEQIIKVYQDKDIDKYLMSKVKYEDIQDIKQNAIIQLLKVKNKDRIINMKNYFFIIVKNEVKKYYRKKDRNKTVELKEEMIKDNDIFDYLELIDIKKDYPILYKFYVLGLTVEELKQEYQLEKSMIYNKIKQEKELLRSEWNV